MLIMAEEIIKGGIMNINDKQIQGLYIGIAHARKSLMDNLQFVLKGKEWETARSRVLKAFGRDGLEGVFDSVFKGSKPRVVIEVVGGVTDVTYASPGIDVQVIDHDNDNAGGIPYADPKAILNAWGTK
jgi:hypothetical protein